MKIRFSQLSKFDYAVFYTIFKNIIYILAIANHYKNPNSYIDRLNENI